MYSTYNVTLRRFRVTIVTVEKVLGITYSVCVCVFVSLVMQHAKDMRRIILSSVTCLDSFLFPTSSHKRHDIREKLLNIKCVL